MKRVILLLSLVLSIGLGCATKPQRSLAAAQDVIYGAKKAWVAYLKAEYTKINQLPAEEQIPLREALAKRQLKARLVATKLDTLWWSAWEQNKMNEKAAPPAELLTTIAEFKLVTSSTQ